MSCKLNEIFKLVFIEKKKMKRKIISNKFIFYGFIYDGIQKFTMISLIVL